MAIKDDVTKMLLALAGYERTPNDPERGHHPLERESLVKVVGLHGNRLKDAVDLLEDRDLIDRKKFVDDNIGYIQLTAQGRREVERVTAYRATQAHAIRNRTRPRRYAPGHLMAECRLRDHAWIGPFDHACNHLCLQILIRHRHSPCGPPVARAQSQPYPPSIGRQVVQIRRSVSPAATRHPSCDAHLPGIFRDSCLEAPRS